MLPEPCWILFSARLRAVNGSLDFEEISTHVPFEPLRHDISCDEPC